MKLKDLVIHPLPTKGASVPLTKSISGRDTTEVVFVGADEKLYYVPLGGYAAPRRAVYLTRSLLNTLASHGFLDRKEVATYFERKKKEERLSEIEHMRKCLMKFAEELGIELTDEQKRRLKEVA